MKPRAAPPTALTDSAATVLPQRLAQTREPRFQRPANQIGVAQACGYPSRLRPVIRTLLDSARQLRFFAQELAASLALVTDAFQNDAQKTVLPPHGIFPAQAVRKPMRTMQTPLSQEPATAQTPGNPSADPACGSPGRPSPCSPPLVSRRASDGRSGPAPQNDPASSLVSGSKSGVPLREPFAASRKQPLPGPKSRTPLTLRSGNGPMR